MEALTRERDAGPRPQPQVGHGARLGTPSAEAILGWGGAAALLVAFGLDAVGVMRSSTPASLVLNLVGALGLAYASLSRRAYPPAALNFIWAAVAAVSLVLLAAQV
jgi:hypothetical protein